jgi:hypothetical protein
MKIQAMDWVWITTVFLVFLTVAASLNMRFVWIFFATVTGQALVLVMVYKVLTDSWDTQKTFEDFYEDYPIARE